MFYLYVTFHLLLRHCHYCVFFMSTCRALRKLVNSQQNDWDVYLDATLFSLRSKVHTTTKYTPFRLMYGREATYPSEVPVEVPVSVIKEFYLCNNYDNA